MNGLTQPRGRAFVIYVAPSEFSFKLMSLYRICISLYIHLQSLTIPRMMKNICIINPHNYYYHYNYYIYPRYTSRTLIVYLYDLYTQCKSARINMTRIPVIMNNLRIYLGDRFYDQCNINNHRSKFKNRIDSRQARISSFEQSRQRGTIFPKPGHSRL